MTPTANDAHALISAQSISGAPVFNLDGERLGLLEDVMIHRLSGRMAYAVMNFEEALGTYGKTHPLPWSILKFDSERNGYVVPLSRAQLEDAPAMTPEQYGADDASWGERVHAHFQVTPAWM